MISAHFDPDPAAGQRVKELCVALAALGHKVIVFTSTPQRDSGGHLPESIAGLEVRRLWSPLRSGIGLLRKTTAMVAFHATSALRVLTDRVNFDVIITISTPPLAHVVGACLALARNSKHVFWCADLHPESAIRLGLLRRSSLLARILVRLDSWALHKCDAIVAVGSCMRDALIDSGAVPERTFVLPMWQRDDVGMVGPSDCESFQLRSRLGYSAQYVAMYSGNLGRMHHFETVFESAKRLTDVTFLIAGSGPGMRAALEFKSRTPTPNLHCRDLFPEDQLSISLSLPDVHLITLRSDMCAVSVPGKLYGAMASGRPVIFIGPKESEVALTIQKENCGFVVAPGDVDGLVGVLRHLKTFPELAREMGVRGRQAFRKRYCMSILTAKWVRLVECISKGDSVTCELAETGQGTDFGGGTSAPAAKYAMEGCVARPSS